MQQLIMAPCGGKPITSRGSFRCRNRRGAVHFVVGWCSAAIYEHRSPRTDPDPRAATRWRERPERSADGVLPLCTGRRERSDRRRELSGVDGRRREDGRLSCRQRRGLGNAIAERWNRPRRKGGGRARERRRHREAHSVDGGSASRDCARVLGARDLLSDEGRCRRSANSGAAA